MTAPPPNLLLIGLRTSGKSTLGREVAVRRDADFLDLDDEVLGAMGHATVADAWRSEGEYAFRRAETRTLQRALEQAGRVIALGGGTPTAPGAADAIRAAQRNGTAIVVYLHCTAEELRRRFALLGEEGSGGAGGNRPSLTGRDPLEEIEDVYAARDPLYRELADHVVDGISSLEEGVARLEPIW